MKTIVITAAVAGLAGCGLHMVASNKPTPSITVTNSVIIQNGAGSLNIPSRAFGAAQKSAVSDAVMSKGD